MKYDEMVSLIEELVAQNVQNVLGKPFKFGSCSTNDNSLKVIPKKGYADRIAFTVITQYTDIASNQIYEIGQRIMQTKHSQIILREFEVDFGKINECEREVKELKFNIEIKNCK